MYGKNWFKGIFEFFVPHSLRLIFLNVIKETAGGSFFKAKLGPCSYYIIPRSRIR
jgi:hypothetical protein